MKRFFLKSGSSLSFLLSKSPQVSSYSNPFSSNQRIATSDFFPLLWMYIHKNIILLENKQLSSEFFVCLNKDSINQTLIKVKPALKALVNLSQVINLNSKFFVFSLESSLWPIRNFVSSCNHMWKLLLPPVKRHVSEAKLQVSKWPSRRKASVYCLFSIQLNRVHTPVFGLAYNPRSKEIKWECYHPPQSWETGQTIKEKGGGTQRQQVSLELHFP